MEWILTSSGNEQKEETEKDRGGTIIWNNVRVVSRARV